MTIAPTRNNQLSSNHQINKLTCVPSNSMQKYTNYKMVSIFNIFHKISHNPIPIILIQLVPLENVIIGVLMHPSKETLNSPSSRVDADSTSRRRRILRCIFWGLVNLDLINFLTMWIFTLCEFRPGESWTNAVYISSENVLNTKVDCSKNVLLTVVLVEYKLKWMCC